MLRRPPQLPFTCETRSYMPMTPPPLQVLNTGTHLPQALVSSLLSPAVSLTHTHTDIHTHTPACQWHKAAFPFEQPTYKCQVR